MTQLERQIQSARHRLWLNRGLAYLCWCFAGAGACFAAAVLIERLFILSLPLLGIGTILAVAALAAATLWTVIRRDSSALAAATLDQAAGLRERLSSGRHCLDADDPFARAVVADAERTAGSLSARRHIRVTAPQPLALSAGAILVAALMFLVPAGLLERSEATEQGSSTFEFQQAKLAVKRKMDRVREVVEANPALEELSKDLERMDNDSGGRLQRPGDLRHLAAKKIDRLQDAVKRKQESAKYGMVGEMRKLMRGLKVPKQANAATSKLSKALAQGDFKTAQEEVRKLKEQLATLKTQQDEELVAKMSKQLDDLAKQLEQVAKKQNLAKKLEQAGLKKEDIERLLENLKKKDLDQIKKQLEEKGWDQKAIEKLTKQLQQSQQAGAVAKKLSQAMKQASQCNNPGQMGEAMAGLSMAGDQLSDLEQLDQELDQLGSMAADLQDIKDEMQDPCPNCNGTGNKDGRLCGQ